MSVVANVPNGRRFITLSVRVQRIGRDAERRTDSFIMILIIILIINVRPKHVSQKNNV